MNANELRIGNWVNVKNIVSPVSLGDILRIVDGDCACSPIPLTPEILEQCGFEIEKGYSTSNYTHYAYGGFIEVKFSKKGNTVYMCIGGIKCPLDHIKSLDQLQNFIYFTFNTELQWNTKKNQMKTITTNNRTLLFMEVPEDAIKELMHITKDNYFCCEDCTLIWSGNPPEPDHDEWRTLLDVQLPEGNYKFLTTTDTIPADLGITDTLLAEHGITGRHAIIEVI